MDLNDVFNFLDELFFGDWMIYRELPEAYWNVAPEIQNVHHADYYLVLPCKGNFLEKVGIVGRLKQAGVDTAVEVHVDEWGVIIAALKVRTPNDVGNFGVCEFWAGKKYGESLQEGFQYPLTFRIRGTQL